LTLELERIRCRATNLNRVLTNKLEEILEQPQAEREGLREWARVSENLYARDVQLSEQTIQRLWEILPVEQSRHLTERSYRLYLKPREFELYFENQTIRLGEVEPEQEQRYQSLAHQAMQTIHQELQTHGRTTCTEYEVVALQRTARSYGHTVQVEGMNLPSRQRTYVINLS
jgi:hypothetical protein